MRKQKIAALYGLLAGLGALFLVGFVLPGFAWSFILAAIVAGYMAIGDSEIMSPVKTLTMFGFLVGVLGLMGIPLSTVPRAPGVYLFTVMLLPWLAEKIKPNFVRQMLHE